MIFLLVMKIELELSGLKKRALASRKEVSQLLSAIDLCCIQSGLSENDGFSGNIIHL